MSDISQRMLLYPFVVILFLFSTELVHAQSHEWTTIDPTSPGSNTDSIQQVLKDLQYPGLNSTDTIAVWEFLAGNKVTLLWYFASWCWNCNQEVPILNNMYDKFNPQGFEVLGVGVYSPKVELENFRQKYDLKFPVVVGPSEVKSLETRQHTYHYSLRKFAGDTRTWGTPFHIFVVDANTDSMFTAAGEIREDDFEEFLQKHTHTK